MLTTIAVMDYVQHSTLSVKPASPLSDAVNILLSKKLSGLPVVDDHGTVIGFVSEQDCIRSMLSASYFCENTQLVDDVMIRAPLVVDSQESVVQVAEKMISNKLRVYPVVNQGKLIGLITRADILRALQTHLNTCSIPAHA